MSTRRRPLTAALEPIEVLDEVYDDIGPLPQATDVIVDPAGEAARMQQLTEGIRRLRVGTSLNLNERVLMIAGGVIAPLGLLIIVLGWVGAAGTGYVFEQIPYLISGGLLGIGLVFLGAFFYFAHWMTQLVKEHRAQSTAIIDAIVRLQDEVVRQAGADRFAGAPSNGQPTAASAPVSANDDGAEPLVATAAGTMAHRAECVVVAGKPGLRRVSEDDGLAACKMCDPYGSAS